MTDFFREVDEEVRRDRVIQFWTRYRYVLIALAVLIVAGTAAWRVYKHFHDEAAARASAKYETALQLSRDGKSVEAQAAFNALAKEGPKGYVSLARLRGADEIAKSDPNAAIEAYEALVNDAAYDRSFQDVARLRAAFLRLDRDDPKDFEQRFTPFAGATFAYRNSIREFLALAALKRNDIEAAGRWLDAIVADQLAPNDLRIRAGALLGLVQAGKPPSAKAPPH